MDSTGLTIEELATLVTILSVLIGLSGFGRHRLNQHERRLSKVEQRQADHEKSCEERGKRIESTVAEIRVAAETHRIETREDFAAVRSDIKEVTRLLAEDHHR